MNEKEKLGRSRRPKKARAEGDMMEKRRDMGKQSNCQQNGILSMSSMCMGKRDRSQSFYCQDDTIHEMGK
jgi:hypothetical protein